MPHHCQVWSQDGRFCWTLCSGSSRKTPGTPGSCRCHQLIWGGVPPKLRICGSGSFGFEFLWVYYLKRNPQTFKELGLGKKITSMFLFKTPFWLQGACDFIWKKSQTNRNQSKPAPVFDLMGHNFRSFCLQKMKNFFQNLSPAKIWVFVGNHFPHLELSFNCPESDAKPCTKSQFKANILVFGLQPLCV